MALTVWPEVSSVLAERIGLGYITWTKARAEGDYGECGGPKVARR